MNPLIQKEVNRLWSMTRKELYDKAQELDIDNRSNFSKTDLIYVIALELASRQPVIDLQLELRIHDDIISRITETLDKHRLDKSDLDVLLQKLYLSSEYTARGITLELEEYYVQLLQRAGEKL